jgi:hypothetical protein
VEARARDADAAAHAHAARRPDCGRQWCAACVMCREEFDLVLALGEVSTATSTSTAATSSAGKRVVRAAATAHVRPVWGIVRRSPPRTADATSGHAGTLSRTADTERHGTRGRRQQRADDGEASESTERDTARGTRRRAASVAAGATASESSDHIDETAADLPKVRVRRCE